ncbi:hypothetical protein SHIRM173S_09010 [Streptomyces hirsutus]
MPPERWSWAGRCTSWARSSGGDPPFRTPVFVLTHRARPAPVKESGTTFTFVTGGIRGALDRAKAAAGDGNVDIAGGASTVRQYLGEGLVDELRLHVVPALLGTGMRLFEAGSAGRRALDGSGWSNHPSPPT